MQFIKFGMVGLCNSVINYIIYIVCIKAGMHYVLSNIVGYIITILIAYFLQNRFVFKGNADDDRQVWWKVLIKTYASYFFTGFIVTNLLSFFWLDIFDLTTMLEPLYQLSQQYFVWEDEYMFAEFIVPFFNLFLIVPLNFLINKYWAYKSK